jgi:hypothetical protein
MKHCSMWWWILPLAPGAPERLAGGDAKRTRQYQIWSVKLNYLTSRIRYRSIRAILGDRPRVDFGTLPQSKERARMANPVGDERCTLNTPETP